MDSKGYYKTLGVKEDATQDEIKSAYKKLCVKWHPDKWVSGTEQEKRTAEEKFKEIAEAYDVIGDPKKRKEYDNGGTFNFEGFDPFSAFREHFGGFGGFNPFGGFGGNMESVGSDISVTVRLTLKEAYSGVKKSVEFEKDGWCTACNGTGSEDGKEKTCPECGGTGMKVESRQNGNMFFQTTHRCSHCGGTGKVIEHKCKVCHGTGIKKIKTTETIDIPAGVDTGMQMRINGLGNAPTGGNGRNGDLIVTFNVAEDPYFKRVDQLNIVHYESVPFADAILGTEKEFDCLDGTKFRVKLPELTKDGQAFYQRKKGMPDVNHNNVVGDYAVVIKYEYPNKLTKKQKELLKELQNDINSGK